MHLYLNTVILCSLHVYIYRDRMLEEALFYAGTLDISQLKGEWRKGTSLRKPTNKYNFKMFKYYLE